MDNFINKVMTMVDIKIEHCEKNYVLFDANLPISRIRKTLKELRKKFVFAQAGKR